jgi:hypothetical protein
MPLPPDADLERLATRAVTASRRDPALARMLPVFFWRVRNLLDLERLADMAERQGQVPYLGFFLQAAAELGRTRRFAAILGRLRGQLRPTRPRYFFLARADRPFERMAADLSTPAQAWRWGLRMNMGWDSFADHFHKAASL